MVDLDGTLLMNDGFLINNRNIDIIKKLSKIGHYVVICTGRPFRGSWRIYRKLGIKTMISCNNGAHILNPFDDSHKDEIEVINKDTLTKILTNKFIKNNNRSIFIDTRAFPITNKLSSIMDRYAHLIDGKKFSIMNLSEPKLINSVIDPLAILIETMPGEDPKKYQEIIKNIDNTLITKIYEIRGTFKYIIDVTSKNANKGKALEKICRYYNIPLEKTIAFGDNDNDIEMLKIASHGVKMLHHVKELDDVTNNMTRLSNHDGGVGEYLEKFFNLIPKF